MTTETFTHRELSNITGVSVTTIKSYRKKFPEFFFIVGHGKPLRFRKGADKLCLRIRDLFNKNLSVRQIRDKLLTEFESVKENSQLSVNKDISQVNNEDFEKLAKTTAQMMNGMAALVTAQAKSEQRLVRMEKSLKEFIAAQSEKNSETAEILKEIKEIISASGGLQQPERITAKKVVTIKKDDGDSESYSLDADSSAIEPESDFLELPVVIHSDTGDFLGMPGKPGHPFTLEELVNLVSIRKEDNSAKVWHRQGRDWVLAVKAPEGPLYELHFSRTHTPKGNIVSFFKRLDINSESQSPAEILSFFREMRDLIDTIETT
jgi:DNA-binding transcriptional MerR regulator